MTSRAIAPQLCTTGEERDATDTEQVVCTASRYYPARLTRKPRLLSGNGSSYVSVLQRFA